MSKPALEPAIITIFGITGDLSQRKLLPSLYHLIKDGLLHDKTQIVGITRRDVSAKELLDNVELCINETDKVCDPAVLKKMYSITKMIKMDLVSDDDYEDLKTKLDAIETKEGECMNRLFYLSIPPQMYDPIIRLLGEHKLNAGCQHHKADSRLLIEKPFGYDLASACELIENTSKQFREDQIFRIDHYLAKETVQNILTFRFRNPIFEAAWDADHISHIDILAAEKIGIEGRAVFYEEIGALRDFIQSHLLQLLAIVTMEEPKSFTDQSIHESRQALLDKIEPVPTSKINERVVRGQYNGYRGEVENSKSKTETYAAIKIFINNKRWQKVPVTLRTGKALKEKRTEVRITFCDKTEHTNALTFRIQPDEGIGLELEVKKPGYAGETQTTNMDFSYQSTFGYNDHPDAYERVLVDAVRGDHTLFATSSEVTAAWRIVDPVLKAWSQTKYGLQIYKKGGAGPELPAKFLS